MHLHCLSFFGYERRDQVDLFLDVIVILADQLAIMRDAHVAAAEITKLCAKWEVKIQRERSSIVVSVCRYDLVFEILSGKIRTKYRCRRVGRVSRPLLVKAFQDIKIYRLAVHGVTARS